MPKPGRPNPRHTGPRVLTNQVGYESDKPKRAVVLPPPACR
jgi:hypothetical protein